MPVIKSAIKKLRQDRKREKHNDLLRQTLKSSVRAAKKVKTGKAVSHATAVVDKAAKNGIIHDNKASRLKASLSKIARPTSAKVSQTKTTTKAASTSKTTKKTIATKKAAPKKSAK